MSLSDSGGRIRCGADADFRYGSLGDIGLRLATRLLILQEHCAASWMARMLCAAAVCLSLRGRDGSNSPGHRFFRKTSCSNARPPAVEGAQLAANPTTQWFYSSVSKASLQKTGVFLDSAGDFGNVRPKKFEHRSPETFGDEKSPHLAGLSHPKKDIL